MFFDNCHYDVIVYLFVYYSITHSWMKSDSSHKVHMLKTTKTLLAGYVPQSAMNIIIKVCYL